MTATIFYHAAPFYTQRARTAAMGLISALVLTGHGWAAVTTTGEHMRVWKMVHAERFFDGERAACTASPDYSELGRGQSHDVLVMILAGLGVVGAVIVAVIVLGQVVHMAS